MNFADIAAFAWGTPNAGEQNQILGALKAVSDITGQNTDINKAVVLPAGVESLADMKKELSFTMYPDYDAFRRDVFSMLDCYFEKKEIVPRIFVTAYIQAQNQKAGTNVDMLCRAVKEYYSERGLGTVVTTVLTSRFHKYKYVDLINIPKHLLTFHTRIRLLQDKQLRRRSLITTGTINNFSRENVNRKKQDLLEKMKTLRNDDFLQKAVAKLEYFKNCGKKIVFCLGGRVAGPEIDFNLNYVKKLYSEAESLAVAGYGIVFVNGTRTPNDITEYLYEKTFGNERIFFQNCKKVAESDEDRKPEMWRIYSGKYEDDFRRLQKLGNIYPGILGFKNTLVVHTTDSYASCETASAAIPTAVSSKGLHIDEELRYDCFNLYRLMCPKYAIDWDEFLHLARHMKVEPKDLHPQILSNPLRVFAEFVLNRAGGLLESNQ